MLGGVRLWEFQRCCEEWKIQNSYRVEADRGEKKGGGERMGRGKEKEEGKGRGG